MGMTVRADFVGEMAIRREALDQCDVQRVLRERVPRMNDAHGFLHHTSPLSVITVGRAPSGGSAHGLPSESQ